MSDFNLTAKQISKNWNTFRNLINERFPSRKDALNRMYDEMELDERVQMAPASSFEFFHNAIPGGYVDHVLRVYEFALETYQLWKKMGLVVDNFTEEELEFSALHHDLGKLGLPGENKEYYMFNDSEWHRKNQGKIYKGNPNVPWMKTNDVTFYLFNHYGVKYSVNEQLAIKLTDGLFEETNKDYYAGFSLESKLRTSLPYILHQADIMAFRYEFERWAKSSSKFELSNGDVKPLIQKSEQTNQKPGNFSLDNFDDFFKS